MDDSVGVTTHSTTDVVRLFVNAGWDYVTTYSPSSPFCDLLSSLREATDSLPSEIELTGSVGEIVAEEWRHYETIVRREVVSLHLISRLSRILTMPVGWRKYVVATKDSSMEERLVHLRQLVDIVGLEQYNFNSFTNAILYRLRNQAIELQGRGNVLALIDAFAYNVMLTGTCWVDVTWEDLVPLLSEAIVSDKLKKIIANTVELLQGVGSPHAECVTIQHDTFIVTNDSLTHSCTLHDWDVLYDRVLASYPVDEGPIPMGLEPILNAGKVRLSHNYTNGCLGGAMRLEGVVPWLHFNTLLFPTMDHQRYLHTGKTTIWGSLHPTHFARVIVLLDVGIVGRKGLLRILQCLELYAETHKNKRVDQFITLTRERVDTAPDPVTRMYVSAQHPLIRQILD